MYSNHLLLVGRTEVPSGKPFYNQITALFFFCEARCWLVESLNVFFEEWDKTSPESPRCRSVLVYYHQIASFFNAVVSTHLIHLHRLLTSVLKWDCNMFRYNFDRVHRSVTDWRTKSLMRTVETASYWKWIKSKMVNHFEKQICLGTGISFLFLSLLIMVQMASSWLHFTKIPFTASEDLSQSSWSLFLQ